MVYEDIFEEIRKIERRLNRLFDELWHSWSSGRISALPRAEEAEEIKITPYREPLSDIIENEKEIKVIAEIPGVEKSDIKINATQDSVEISAEAKKEEEEKGKGYAKRERRYTRFYRRFALPKAVIPEKAKARYKNGVLEITIPKAEEEKKTTIKIE